MALINWKGYLGAGAIAALLTAGGMWVLKGDLDRSTLADERTAHANDNEQHANGLRAISAEAASAASGALAEQTRLQGDIDALTRSHAKENENAEKSLASLRAAVRTGQQQLYVHATCTAANPAGNSIANGGASSTVDERHETTRAELDATDADALLGIVGDGDDAIRALNEAQDYICTIRPTSDGCTAVATAAY